MTRDEIAGLGREVGFEVERLVPTGGYFEFGPTVPILSKAINVANKVLNRFVDAESFGSLVL